MQSVTHLLMPAMAVGALLSCADLNSDRRPTPPVASPTNQVVTTPLSETPHLAASDQTGLLGVPLPQGAKLVGKTAGDSKAGRDPSQRYAISASAAEIIAFFTKVMPAAGWTKDGASRPTSVFFRKGNLMIGVLTNKDGGTFTLMGS